MYDIEYFAALSKGKYESLSNAVIGGVLMVAADRLMELIFRNLTFKMPLV